MSFMSSQVRGEFSYSGHPPFLKSTTTPRKPYFRRSKPLRGIPMNQAQSNGYGFAQPQSFPHAFDELHTERIYLIDSLQKENTKATTLLRKIAALEEIIISTVQLAIRRKNKKQLSWCKSRLDETGKQERTMLARLGQVTHEIQSRERWTQIQNEARWHEQQINERMALHQRMRQQIQLNAESAEFVPTPLSYFPTGDWPQNVRWHSSARECVSELPVPSFSREEASPTNVAIDLGTGMNGAVRTQSSAHLDLPVVDYRKRLSMPELREKGPWLQGVVPAEDKGEENGFWRGHG